MPGILIERGGYLREILQLLRADSWDCQWLVTELECYQTWGWEGCEKWAREPLLLTNRELLGDLEARDLQFVWGIFSAIPARYSQREILSCPLPAFQDEAGNWAHGKGELLPQHPLAFLELLSEDSTSITAVAREAAILKPLETLPCWTEDAEAQNRRFQEVTAIAQRMAEERGYGAMGEHLRRNLYGQIWRTLYHHRPDRPVRREDVEALYLRYWKGEN